MTKRTLEDVLEEYFLDWKCETAKRKKCATAIREHIKEEKRELLKPFEELTPQGSEFYNNPAYVVAYLKDRIDSGYKAKKELVLLKRKIKGVVPEKKDAWCKPFGECKCKQDEGWNSCRDQTLKNMGDYDLP